MSQARQLALRLAAIKAVKDVVTAAEKAAKAEAADVLDPGDRKNAVTDDGASVGTITYAQPSDALRVVDESAFLAWVKQNRPSAVVESVRESDKTSILTAAQATGELPDGVDLVTRAGYITVRQSPAQVAALMAANPARVFELVTQSVPAIQEEKA